MNDLRGFVATATGTALLVAGWVQPPVAFSETTRVAAPGGGFVGETAGLPALSADCRQLAVAQFEQIYVLDRATHESAMVSLSPRGAPGDRGSVLPSLSADGRVVSFTSSARNLTTRRRTGTHASYVRDLRAPEAFRLPRSEGAAVLSPNGHAALYASRAAGRGPGLKPVLTLYSYGLRTRRLRVVSRSSNGARGNGDSVQPASSYDGSIVAFASDATNLAPRDGNGTRDVFVRDRARATTLRMSRGRGAEANGPSDFPSLDWSGRHVAFASDASNLVVGDVNGRRDVFVVDRNARRTRLVSRAIDGGPSNGDSDFPVLSGDGRLVVFTSRASNLVSGDRNGMPDVFLHDRAERTTRRVSVSSNGDSADDESGNAGARISANGRCIGFESFATNLVRGDDNRRVDFFLRDEAR